MTILDSYSSWCRNLLTAEDRAAIAQAGVGGVRFSRPNGRWCARIDAEQTAVGFGSEPGAAFRAALAALRQGAAA